MEDGLDPFGIDELLNFSHDNELDFSHDDSSMQALSAASSDSAEEFINSNSGSLSSLMDSRSFCPPELGWFDFDNAKVLLGSSAREEEKNRMRSQQQEEQLYMMSPVSVLESCATSERERPAMVSISSVHAGDVKNVSPSTTKRGRPVTSTVRTSYSASSDEEVEDEEEEEEEEEDDDDDDGDVELDEEEEEDDDEDEEEDEDEEGSDEQSEIHGSDCALSTESEVVTEEDDGFRPPPAKRQSYEQLHHHHQQQQQRRQQQQQRQNQHQSYEQSRQQQQQNCQEISLRKCSHCQTQKTPQWRAGPLGPKTLCNACGVRFKSGRLLPEYRPAGSPSFVSDKHSNSHRKVLEMRRQREMEVVKKLKAEAEGEIAEETAMLGRVG